jgi:quercetin dioxygenase-like cupin family protein
MKKAPAGLVAVMMFGAGVLVGPSQTRQPVSDRETLATKFSAQPPNAPGMTLTTVIAEYKPGAFTPPHHHGQAFAMIFVLEGTIVNKVDDGNETVLHAGDHFTEAPNAHHVTFRNPSKTKTTRILATFLAPSAEAERDLAILDSK